MRAGGLGTSGKPEALPLLYGLSPVSSSRSGRTSFYEEYGVIRDVLQNHLTEILSLVAMELPYNVSSSEAVLQHKLQAFQALRGLRKGSAVVGQYQAYSEQVRRELHKPPGFHSLTPTFAGGLWGRHGLRAAPHPRLEAAVHAQTPFGLGYKGLDVGFSQGHSVASETVIPLPVWPSASLEQQVTCWLPLGEGLPCGGLILVHVHTPFQGSPSRAHTWLPPSWSIRPAPPQCGCTPALPQPEAPPAGAPQSHPLDSCTGSELPGEGWLPLIADNNPSRTAAIDGVPTMCQALYIQHLI